MGGQRPASGVCLVPHSHACAQQQSTLLFSRKKNIIKDKQIQLKKKQLFECVAAWMIALWIGSLYSDSDNVGSL